MRIFPMNPRVGDHIWMPDHICDTLCNVHLELFDAETRIRIRIDQMARAAELKLSAMVEEGERRQMLRMLRWRLRNQGARSVWEQRRLHEQWKLRGAVGSIAGYSQHARGLAVDTEIFS